MNRKWLEKHVEEIDVPKDEVYSAIAKGMKAGKEKKNKKKRKKIKSGIFVSAAASLFLASGFVFTPITNVLAKVPILGSIYGDFAPQVGTGLFAKNLVTALDQEATSNGVKVTVTSAYFDGNVIGVTFKAKGKDLTIEHMDEGNRPVSGYSYHLFDGLDENQWASSGTELKEVEDGYVGAIEFYNPDGKIPSNFTLSLAFTHMADVNGNWKFDVPVEKLPSEKIPTVYESHSKDGAYSFKMGSIIKGQATTLFEYKTIVPSIGKGDDIEITVFDDNNNRLNKNSTDLIGINEENGWIERSERELFTSEIDKDASYLMVYPEIRQYEVETIKSISSSFPFQIESNRFDYKIQVTNVEATGNELTVDYFIQNVDNEKIRQDIIQGFANFIKVIHTDNIKLSKNGELLYDQMLEFSIRSEQTNPINTEELQFQSTFVIDVPHKFDYEEYSLMVPFGTLSSNDSIKMDPIKITLKN